jgi:hypothetical protein
MIGMPFNLLKNYPELLEIVHMGEPQRKASLMGIFKRDIEENSSFRYKSKQIRPVKKDGIPDMQVLYHHLTTREDKDGKGKKLGTRSFEMARSQRLHWVLHHVNERQKKDVTVFSYEDRIDGKDVIRTYIFDTLKDYVIILQPQNSGIDYYLITAYYLNEPGGKKQIIKKELKKLPHVH